MSFVLVDAELLHDLATMTGCSRAFCTKRVTRVVEWMPADGVQTGVEFAGLCEVHAPVYAVGVEHSVDRAAGGRPRWVRVHDAA